MTDFPAADFIENLDPNNQGNLKDQLESLRAATVELLGGAAETNLEIVSGSVTPTAAIHSVDTEGAAAADNLDWIDYTNHPDGRLLLLRAYSAARVVTVRSAQGGNGEIILAPDRPDSTSGQFTLDATDKFLLLMRDGTQWVEVARFFGADRDASRYHDMDMRGYISGLNVTYVDDADIHISGGTIEIHDDTTVKRYRNLAELTKTLSGLTVSSVCYVYVDPPATGNSLVAADIEFGCGDSHAPIWVQNKQGFYHQTNTDWRFIGSVVIDADGDVLTFKRSADGRTVRLGNLSIILNAAIPTVATGINLSAYCPGIGGAIVLFSVRADYDSAGGTVYTRPNGFDANQLVGYVRNSATAASFTNTKERLAAPAILEWYASDAGIKGFFTVHGYEEPR